MSTTMKKYGLLLMLLTLLFTLPTIAAAEQSEKSTNLTQSTTKSKKSANGTKDTNTTESTQLIQPTPSTKDAKSTSIIIDDKKLTLPSNAEVKNMNQSVMIPLRVVIEHLGFAVDWQKESKQLHISDGTNKIELTVGSNTSIVNGTETTLSSPPVVEGGTALVPLRFVGEQFGLKVRWDNANKSVLIQTPPPPKEEVNPDPSQNETIPPGNKGSNKGSHSGTAQINSIDYMDNKLMVEVQGTVQPKIFTMTEPNRIVMDIPATAFTTDFINGQLTNGKAGFHGKLDNIIDNPHIEQVRYSLFDEKSSTIRIVLDTRADIGYTITDGGSESGLLTMELHTGDQVVPPAVTDPPTTTPPITTPPTTIDGKKIVVIDPGHGARDSGAVGVSGKYEKDFVLALALKVEQLLLQEENIQVMMTRTDDTFIEVPDRIEVANRVNAAAFVSIHANSAAPNRKAGGTETYYYPTSHETFADIMHKHILGATKFTDRKVKRHPYTVLAKAKVPAVLLEIGFLSNPQEEQQMLSEQFQNRVAVSIVNGIKESLGVK
ncbi:N-acetylmuramoyl-L-alanine amidase family protein [Paenibacillus arenosi]|uniref:N-acetylmuramoyl-L-alanine amidase n=1 Tax=Paenibacillus arenosi TaxID=2774142 RepID=A0ABR9B077_9BACL|nr:N-acetylmuramoyl-L-alanine amidase family protein [Paenibacillus arenosi]MBD8498847.1 N-acetylmuramoyl-L-alanine amidase [Paenibacillus arenosi]